MADDKNKPGLTQDATDTINNLLRGLRYGTILIVVQDGKIIQIEKTEKHRLKDR